MRRVTSIICSIGFAIFGICLATMNVTPSSNLVAANASSYEMPVIQTQSMMQLPLDLQLDQQIREDSVTQKCEQRSAPKEQIAYVHKRSYTPDKIVRKARVNKPSKRAPEFYLATYIGNKDDTNNSLSIYEVYKVDDKGLKDKIPLDSITATHGTVVEDSINHALR